MPMNTAHQAPVLTKVDTVILGGSLRGLFAALEEAAGGSVLLATEATMLPQDICQANRYSLCVTPEDHPLWQALTASAATEGGALHPDRLKQTAEELCEKAGVQLLYGVTAVGRTPEALTLAGKFGLALVETARVLDLRSQNTGSNRYIVHLENCPMAPGSLVEAEGYRAHLLEGCGADHRLLAFELKETQDIYQCRSTALAGFRTFCRLPGWEAVTLGRFALEGYWETDESLQLPEPGRAARQAKAYLCQGEPLPVNCVAHNPLAERLYVRFGTPAVIQSPTITAQTLVVGGGTTGLPAALSSAEEGAQTLLAEMNPGWGGTGTLGGVSAYWFGRRYKETCRIDQEVLELANGIDRQSRKGIWGDCDIFHPDIKEHALGRLCRKAGVDARIGLTAFAAVMEKDRIVGVYFATQTGVQMVKAQWVIDTTGDGDIAAFCGVPFTYGSERDGFTYWASLAQYKDSCGYQNNFAGLVRVDDPVDYTRFIRQARQRGKDSFDHGVYLAPRETRHIRGRRTVTLHDLCSFRNYSDCICTCFSNYDPKGRTDSSMVYAGVLPLQNGAAIPLGAVVPEGVEGLLVGGKAISCTHNALPALRMQPDLQRQGAVLGFLAAGGVKEGRLLPDFAHIAAKTDDPLQVAVQHKRPIEQWVDDFCRQPCTNWMELDFAHEQLEQPPAMAIMTAPASEVVPALRFRFQKTTDRWLKATLAAMLLFFGEAEGAPWLAQWLTEQLEYGLPTRRGSLVCVQLLPDHGVMAEEAYLLAMLGRAPVGVDILPSFRALCNRLEETVRDWTDNRAGIFPYLDSMAYAAEQSGRAEFMPLLRRMTQLPELQQAYPLHDLCRERLLMMRLILWRTLWLLGDPCAQSELQELQKSELAQVAVAAGIALEETDLPSHEHRW